jgi:MerR family transcriptional regulator, light-induced transcriptional regulator
LLRAWERRYEVVKPSRSAGGRRLYSDADVERLRLLYRATLSGRNIGQVADLPTDALAALVQKDAAEDAAAQGARDQRRTSALDADTLAADYLGDCLRAIERLDPIALNVTLQRAAIVLSAEALFDTLLVPLLERVGTRTHEGTLRPVHGHVASAVVRRLLDGVTERASSPHATANLVVATPAGQVHELGALLLAAAAATEGWRATYLGADLSAEDIAEAAVGMRARAVALGVGDGVGRSALGDEFRRLARALPKDVALLVGGAASPAYSAVLDEIGAVRLNDLADLRVRLRMLQKVRRAKRRAA